MIFVLIFILIDAVGATDFSKANLKEVSISSDRGVNSASVYNELVVKGAYVTGTVPHNNSAKQQPFVSFSSHDLLEVAENDTNNQACCKFLESGCQISFLGEGKFGWWTYHLSLSLAAREWQSSLFGHFGSQPRTSKLDFRT